MAEYPKEVDIPVPWGIISAKWWGPETKEPILFLHGWQDNLGSFDKLIPMLPQGLPYLAFDFPGHGLSSPFPKGTYYYIFWEGVILLRRLSLLMGWKKISIIGHSLGGGIGFMYAALFPEHVDKLVSLDIVGPRIAKPSTNVSQAAKGIEKFLKYESLEDAEVCYDYDEAVKIVLDAYHGSLTERSAKILLKRGLRLSEKEQDKFVFSRDVRLKVAAAGMISRDEVYELANKIKCHYLNIRATKTISMEFPEAYDELLDIIKANAKSFKFAEVEGTHHFHLNNPEDLAPLITDFLVQGVISNGKS